MKPRLVTMLSLLAFVLVFLQAGAQQQRYKGYPQFRSDQEVLAGFMHPPKGYGNVPFYWWNGDTLKKERMLEQLEILAASATDGFAVSYIHTDPHVDTLANRSGYGLYGMTEPGAPRVFSEEWWEIWNWFSAECGKRGMGVGLDDYTVGWVGNGYYPDELDTMSVFRDYPGELAIRVDTVRGGEWFTAIVPDSVIAIVAWPGKTELTRQVKEGTLRWKAPKGKDSRIYTVCTRPGYVIHPEHGQRLVDVYFNRFETRMDKAGREGMNYFFQDELSYPINMLSWSDDFPEEFKRRKGYDIMPYLPALKEYIGAITPKVRLDYCEVLMDLSEERYYRPIYEWHADRGLIYGCDNLSRGKDPAAYIDYFRAMSWFTAPGNDAPSLGSSFLETKVSSSIAHLYRRPRTWLEAFHSMGWGSSGAWLTKQIDHHFMAGGNLVCMHGLYYSTHGGWWEWAPPDFHFRMPYWPHMKQWLAYTERMSYLLSQGDHVCDVALLYPTESLQAYPGSTPDVAFGSASKLSEHGLDYDFVDFRSLRDAVVSGNKLRMANETYQVIVMADMKAIHHASLLKILEFYRAGGIVLATGSLPKASSRKGEGDKEVGKILQELFGISAEGHPDGSDIPRQSNKAGGIGWYLPDGSLPDAIHQLIIPDFYPEEGTGKVLHRRVGTRDIYMVTDVEKGSDCFFRAKGAVELWDANTGSTEVCPVLRQTDEGTFIRMNKETGNSYLVVFSPGEPVTEEGAAAGSAPLYTLALPEEWDISLLPTLYNKWGDYRLPASDGFIGAEARSFRYAPAASSDTAWTAPRFDDSAWPEGIYGYGPQAETCTVDKTDWAPLVFSWQYGVWDSPGAQGYHGLKGKVDNRFFLLDQGGHQQVKTHIYVPEEGVYRIETLSVTPDRIRINDKEVNRAVYLSEGWYPLLVDYLETEQTAYRFKTGAFHDDRRRSMVILFPEQVPLPESPSPYGNEVSSGWGNSGHLLFDPYGGRYDTWNFRFASAPGLEEMTFAVHGKDLHVWVDGERVPEKNIHLTKTCGDWNEYRVTAEQKQLKAGIVTFSVTALEGYQGPAVLKEPVGLTCSAGVLRLGDWSESGALRYYSGGMSYRSAFNLQAGRLGGRLILSLGEVVATCEVKVNGASAGVLIAPPYELDISRYAVEGTNQVEVLVYSTLSNHYQTIPTPYRGDPKAGLIGPVILSVYAK